MSEEREALDTRPYRYYLGCRDREEARNLFVARYSREPEFVKPPDDTCPYWRVGPVSKDVPAADRPTD
jgi:hypothetical protein